MNDSGLDYLFHPRSIAITGVSHDLTKTSISRTYVRGLIEFGFRGKIYPVNPNGGEVFGLKIYPSITDIPDRIDYVISAIPARLTLQLVTDCAARGVKAIHLFTSGFSEIEAEEGKQLEADMLKLARQSGIRILGPNCMGLYCPETNLTFSADFAEQSGFPKQSGPLGFISQSGGNSIYCVNEARARGIYFSKAVSYGNGADLNESDFLEYFADDPETKIISAYIEGVRDGERFRKVLNKVARLKPVIIYKAGTTESGTQAAASHTGSIAGSSSLWDSFLKQAGAIQVHGIEEIVDVAQLFLRIRPPRGKGTAIIGSGGGPSVQAADDWTNAGFSLPTLPSDIRQRLKDIYQTEAGHIFRNPVDTLMRSEILPTTIKIIADCDQIDLLLFHIAFDTWSMIDKREIVEPAVASILKLNNTMDKPVVTVLHCQSTDGARQLASETQRRLCEAGFAVYPSIKRAASAVSKFIQHNEQHGRQKDK